MNASYHTSEKVTKHCRKVRTSRWPVVGVIVDVRTHAPIVDEVDVKTEPHPLTSSVDVKLMSKLMPYV